MITAPKCGIRGCKHFNGMAKPRSGAEDGKFICDAFHNGIPEEIVHGDDLHLEPFEGDHGIRFEETVNEEWEEKGHAWPWQKYNPSQPRDEQGRFGSGEGGGAGESSRVERARRTHKTSTVEKQRRGEAEQAKLAKAIGGRDEGDNLPFDVRKGKHAIEVKTVMDNNNDKITVHPSSRRRKEEVAKKQGLTVHTVAIDVREGKRSYYHKEGVGAFRLRSMDQVSLKQLKEKFR